jgi:CTP:molybdopterin cytidylyltransferase MocA
MTTALVLAGQRAASDAFAGIWGAHHRALVPVNGVPMLSRVLRTLRDSSPVDHVWVSIDEPSVLDTLEDVRDQVARGEVSLHTSLASPSRSVLDALQRLAKQDPAEPVLVTTADHPLLTPEMVEHFYRSGVSEEADVAVGMVAASRVRERFPDTTRTYLPLRSESWSGANLFAFLTPEGQRAAAFWTRAEQLRKRPWRLASTFGLGSLLLFALRRLDVDAAFERVSRAVGVRVRPVEMPFAEAAVDVDRPSDLQLVERVLAGRG